MWVEVSLQKRGNVKLRTQGGRSPTGGRSLTGMAGEGLRCFVSQAPVRADLIVLLTPILDDDSSLRERPELLSLQAFGSQAAVEALDEPILPRASRFDIESLDSLLLEPELKLPVNELAPVVTADVLRRTMAVDQPFQLAAHVTGTNPSIHVDEVAFASELVDHRQHLEPAAADRPVMNEVPGPYVASMLGLGRQPGAGSPSPALRLPGGNSQPHLPA